MLQQVLSLLFPPQCAYCGETGSGLCERCAPPSDPVVVRLPSLFVTALGLYDGAVRHAVLALKDGRRDVAATLGERIGSLMAPGTLVVPVPTTRRRRLERGFDGCELIAEYAAREAGATAVNGLVQRAGDAQRGRGRLARLAARGRFMWRAEPLAGRRVVLLDDVVTTGATLEDCAVVIRGAGGVVDEAVAVAYNAMR